MNWAGPVPPTTCCATGWPRRPPGAPAAPAECGPAPFSPFWALAALAGCGSEAGITRGGNDNRGHALTVYSMLPQPSQGVSRDVLDGEEAGWLAEAGGTAGAMGIKLRLARRGRRGPGRDRQPGGVGVARRDLRPADHRGDRRAGLGDGDDHRAPVQRRRRAAGLARRRLTRGLTSRAAPGEPERYQPAGVPTFARVVGDDRDEAVALAAAAGSRGTVAVQREPGPESAALAAAVRAQLRARGARLAADPERADALIYAGADAQRAAERGRRGARDRRPPGRGGPRRGRRPAVRGRAPAGRARLRAPRPGSTPELRRFEASFTERFGRRPGPTPRWGYEASAPSVGRSSGPARTPTAAAR